jgi:hypothetical protein
LLELRQALIVHCDGARRAVHAALQYDQAPLATLCRQDLQPHRLRHSLLQSNVLNQRLRHRV